MIVMDDQTTEKAGSGFWAARPRPVQPLSESGRKIRRDVRGPGDGSPYNSNRK